MFEDTEYTAFIKSLIKKIEVEIQEAGIAIEDKFTHMVKHLTS